ncbi:two-component sensor histidine kinase [Verrucomicrobiota bacterium]|nr:two-component sensor histidine kinase [Verrucomicrobiota bacterium]
MIRKILRKVSFRLSLWQALIFAILAIVLSYVTHTLIVEQIRTHEQEVVSFRLSEFTLEYERGGVEAVKTLANARRKRAQRVFFLRLASAENKTIFLRDPEDWLEFNSDLLRKVPVPTDTRIRWMELNAQDGNALYLAMHRLGDGTVIYVGQSREDTDELLGNLRKRALLLAAVLLPLGFAAGIFLTSRALRPVRGLSKTVHGMIETGRYDVKVTRGETDNEINELVSLFNRLTMQIDGLIRSMREALDNVAHDIRSPMTVIRGRAQLALQRGDDLTLSKEALAECVEESDKVLRILNMLMDIAETEAGISAQNLRQIPVAEISAAVADLYDSVAEEKDIRLKSEATAGLTVKGDPVMLRRALANLVDNALKFTPRGGEVSVTVAKTGAEIVFTVRDSGPGIAKGDLPKIWDRFYRSDRSRSTYGMGLGLSFVQATVKAHGGRIECESKPGSGATFRIFLPA